MPETWIDCLPGASALPREERERVDAVPNRKRSYNAGHVLLFEEDNAPMLFVVENGWAAALRNLADGAEQILDLFIPGQIIGLREVNSDESVLTYRALTDLDVRLVRKSDMQDLVKGCPSVGALIFRAITREESWLLDRITALAQRDAAQRLVHLLLELADRILMDSDEVTGNDFQMPLTQEQLGSIVGITPVHVSRTLKKLKEEGLVSFDTGTVRILDRDRCLTFSEYDARQMRMHHSKPE